MLSVYNTISKFEDFLSPRGPRPSTKNENPLAYKSLSIIKKLGDAKFPVYLASSNINNQNYAMKIFPHDEEKPIQNFKNEIRFAVLSHPNVVDILHFENEKDVLQKDKVKKVSYTVMEYAPYGDLFEFVINYGDQFDEKLIRTIFRQLIDGIEYLHSKGIAHLDLKPENLLIGADFNLKIADFDLSYIRGDSEILSNGTKYYRGPEFFKSSSSSRPLDISFSADIYSAGVILFIMKSRGMYPHSEDTNFEGINLFRMMYNNNDDFWKKHCEIGQRKSGFFEKDFKELFNAMTSFNPSDRISVRKIKQSKWYKGKIYSSTCFQKKMKKILKI